MRRGFSRSAAAAALVASVALPVFAGLPVSQPPAGSPAAAPSPMPIVPDISTLPDGAHVIIVPDPAANETVVDIFFKVGQSDEGRWPGINALITRTWISASDNRSAMQLQGDIARAGGAVGSASGSEWTELWGICAPDGDSFAKLTQTLLTHVVSEPLFEEDAITVGRADQLRALALRRDNLLMDVMDEMQSRAYGDAPYAPPLLGTSESIKSLPWAQVGAYYRRYFRPERAVIVVAGNVAIDDAKNRILASIGGGGWDDVQPQHAPTERIASVPPIPAGLREHVVQRHAPAVCIAEGYIAPGTDSKTGAEDYATLLVLDAVVGGGKASRLFALRDLAPADSVPIGYEVRSILLTGRAQSVWSAYVIGDRPPQQLQAQLRATLHELASGAKPITDSEIAHAKIYLKARHLEASERIKDRAYAAGWSDVMGIGASFDSTYDATIDAVTIDEVNAMARKVFRGSPASAHSLLRTP